MAAPEQDLLEDKIQCVRRRDRRFSRHAYYFVLDALDYTMSRLGREQLTGEDRTPRRGANWLAGHQGVRGGPIRPDLAGDGCFVTVGHSHAFGLRYSARIVLLSDRCRAAESRRPSDCRLVLVGFMDGFDFRETFAAESDRESLDRIVPLTLSQRPRCGVRGFLQPLGVAGGTSSSG
jgi:hypothetical protein